MSVIEGGRREEEARRSSGCSTKNKNPTRQCGEQKKRDEDANTSPPHAETCLSASRLKTSHRLTANEEVGNDIGCYLGYNPVAKRCDDYSLACGALSIGKALEDKTATHCERRRLKSHRCILLRLFWSRRCLQAQCWQGPGFGAASLPRKNASKQPQKPRPLRKMQAESRGAHRDAGAYTMPLAEHQVPRLPREMQGA